VWLLQQNFWLQQQKIFVVPNFVVVTIPFFPVIFQTNAVLVVFDCKMNEVTLHTLPHLKCIRLVSARSVLGCINTGVRIELTKNKS